MAAFQMPLFDMTGWPDRAVDALRSQDLSGAIDAFMAEQRVPPQMLLDAWAARQTAASKTGHTYKAMMHLGRVRLIAEAPKKP